MYDIYMYIGLKYRYKYFVHEGRIKFVMNIIRNLKFIISIFIPPQPHPYHDKTWCVIKTVVFTNLYRVLYIMVMCAKDVHMYMWINVHYVVNDSMCVLEGYTRTNLDMMKVRHV